jgi:hypothetical protein
VEIIASGRGYRTVTADAVLDGGLLEGSVQVAAGSRFVLRGHVQGSIQTGGEVVIEGWHQGSIDIAPGGSVAVERGGHTQGSVHNEGRFAVYGDQSGPVSGSGESYVDPGARLATPRRVGNETYWEFR